MWLVFSPLDSLVTLKLLVRKDMLGLTECLVVWQCFNISQSVTLSGQVSY